jgi:hypothetical protein
MRGMSRVGLVWVLAWIVVGGLLLLKALQPAPTTPSVSAVDPAGTAHPAPARRSIAIEDVRVGDRVAARNPEIAQAERDQWRPIEPAGWRKLTLRMPKASGGEVRIELLRPDDWIADAGAEAGATIQLDLFELGVDGPADVLAVEPCPPLSEGSGQVVTGTFAHTCSNLVNVQVDTQAGPIGVTASHPFWSDDRRRFVEAGQLRMGETLHGFGGFSRVVGVEPLAGWQVVYNLEVEGEHVYYISTSDLLVHNGCVSRVWPRHHAFPKYLGGATEQTLRKLPPRLHGRFHGALDHWREAALARRKSTAFFKTQEQNEIIRELRDFYRHGEGGIFQKYLPDFEKALRESRRLAS